LPPPTDPNPPSMKPVRTPLEGQSIPLRKAVGAEAMSPERQKPKTIDLLAESEDFEISNLKSPPSGLRLYEEEVDP